MNTLMLLGRRIFIVSVFLTLALCEVPKALADKPKASGQITFSSATDATFTFGGTTENIGRFTSRGEVEYAAGPEAATMDGTGVVVLTAANGDLLVGAVTSHLDLDANQANFHFSWRDAVTLRDGAVVANTGRFAKHRPPGLVVVTSTTKTSDTPLIIKIILILLS